MHGVALVIGLVGVLIFAAHLFEAIFRHTRIPDVLPLFIIGLILGPLLGIAQPTHFGVVGPVFTAVTFIFILFEAGTGLSIESIRTTYKETSLLTTLTFFCTMIAVSVAAWFLTGLGILRSALLGTVVGCTSVVLVIPIIQHMKIGLDTKSILAFESSMTDALSVILALALIDLIKLSDPASFDLGLVTGKILASFVLSILIGMLCAIAWSLLLQKVHGLENSIFTTAAFVFIVYGLTEWLGFSGPLAALAFGITLGNICTLSILSFSNQYKSMLSCLNTTEKSFFSEIVFALKSLFFVYVGISLQLANWYLIIIGLILTAVIYIIRLPVVRLTIQKFRPVYDASIMSVVIPRGLATAVLASIPFQQGISGGGVIQNIAYSIILFSIVFTSLLIFLIDKTKFRGLYKSVFSKFGKASS